MSNPTTKKNPTRADLTPAQRLVYEAERTTFRITTVRLSPNRGTPIPSPIRYCCGEGHLHPSKQHAVACVQRICLNVALRSAK